MSEFVLLPWTNLAIRKSIINELNQEKNSIIITLSTSKESIAKRFQTKKMADNMFADLWERMNE